MKYHTNEHLKCQIYLQALESAKPKKGARVLVLNASGGLESMAVQLAKALYDAYVVGVTGPNNLDFVKVSSLRGFETLALGRLHAFSCRVVDVWWSSTA